MRLFVRILYAILNGVAVIALLSCIAARYVNPSSFPYFEIIGLTFPLIFIANVIAAICWLAAKEHKKYFLASFIPLVLSLPILFDYFSYKNPEENVRQENAKGLKVLSYNVMACNYLGWKRNSEVKQQIFSYIFHENPDIICFQEFHHDTHESFLLLDSIRQQLNLSYVFYNKSYSLGNHYFQGNLICSRYPIINTGEMKYQKSGNSTIWADIVCGKDTVRVYNSHLESYRLSQTDKHTINDMGKIQNVEPEKVESIVQKLARAIQKRGVQTDELTLSMTECPYSVISCGDFNAPPCSYTYHKVKSENNLKDAFLESGFGIGATFNWWPQLRLDYILVSHNIVCNDFKRTGLKVSDHFPICCTLTLNNE
ncbi:MAG: endonuclease/exonuclease/phosphatase family protein [Bacteroidales bacterium]|nr:endonuclease/exonuclease/phosphatase family protein [Bacteroidales bacterium]